MDRRRGVRERELKSTYINELSRVDMLSSEEEKQLLDSICSGNAARARLQAGEETEELRRIAQEGRRSMQSLVSAKIGLVVYVAKQFARSKVPFQDLIQEGCVALITAVNNFSNAEQPFTSYAISYIEGFLKQLLAKEKYAVHVPVALVSAANKVTRVSLAITQSRGAEPGPEVIAKEMIVSADTVRSLQLLMQTVLSLDASQGEDGEASLGDFLPDSGPASEEEVMRRDLRAKTLELLATLEPLEETVLKLQFGFVDEVPWSLDMISEELGIPLEETNLTAIRALRKMRHPSRSKYLKDYL